MRNTTIALLAAFAVALPAAAKTAAKNDAQVTCNDGTTSKKGQGACSHHGGVASTKAGDKAKASKNKTRAELDQGKKEAKEKSGGILDSLFGRKKDADTAQGRRPTTTPRSSTRDAKSGQPTARCKDGTTSYSAHHSGTCSGHGGVQEWLDQ
jgi:hypothetical protein